MYHWKSKKTNSGLYALSYENDFHDSYGNIVRCFCYECKGKIKAEVTHISTYDRAYFDSWVKAAEWLKTSVELCDEQMDID